MKLFFELLQVALGTRDKLSCVPSAVDWKALYAEAERQAIVGVMLGGLERLPMEQHPPKAMKLQWIGMVQMMEATYKHHCERAAELTRRFGSAGFDSCVLKGIGVAQYYPVASRRQCGDIDLWASPANSEKGEVNSGAFRKKLVAWLRTQCEVDLIVWHHVDAKIFDDVSTEIHVHPAWMYGPGRNRKLQRFFDHESHQWHETGLGFNVPRVEFDAVFSLVHTFHHLLEEGVGLRHIIDYFYVLKKYHTDSQDLRNERASSSGTENTDTSFEHEWSRINQIIDRLGMKKFVGAMMYVLKEVCGMDQKYLLCEPNEKEGRFLLSEIMAGGNFGQTRQDGKVRNSFSRWIMMVKHYPSEVLWMIPWKIWHYFWRFFHN